MKALIMLCALIGSPSVFAGTGFYLKDEAKGAVALAFSDATANKGCTLRLSQEDAPANSAQLVEFTNFEGIQATLVYYKTVSAAGLSQTANMRVYPNESIDTIKARLDEVAGDVGATKLTVGDCYDF
ncbi:MAG: hypothetical protein AB7G93_03530 [Bdellovibrionales bacterium]